MALQEVKKAHDGSLWLWEEASCTTLLTTLNRTDYIRLFLYLPQNVFCMMIPGRNGVFTKLQVLRKGQ